MLYNSRFWVHIVISLLLVYYFHTNKEEVFIPSLTPMPFHASKWLNKMVHKMNRKDFVVLMIDIAAFTLFLVTFFPVLASAHRGRYVAIVIVCETYLRNKLFGEGSKKKK